MSRNYLKYGETYLRAAARKDFKIGVQGSDDYGPSSITGFYKGIEPPVGGYTIYMTKLLQGPSIHVAHNDQQCIFFLKSFITDESMTVEHIKGVIKGELGFPFEVVKEEFYYMSKELKDTDSAPFKSGNEFILTIK